MEINKCSLLYVAVLLIAGISVHAQSQAPPVIPDSLVIAYVERFNAADEELYSQLIPNSGAAEFLCNNVPRFECPDRQIEEIYYFRWWTFRKHLRQTPEGYIITEFLPEVSWAGKYNGISCPAMHHYNEGRWLHDRRYLDSYTDYWLRGGGSLRAYSFPIAASLYNYYLASGDRSLLREYTPDLIANYAEWEKSNFDPNKGLFWQIDGRDGMEVSVGGRTTASGYRATINSYMIAEARTIAAISKPHSAEFFSKADAILSAMQKTLWDADSSFFKVLPRQPEAPLCEARELHGYTPWYFSLPAEEYSPAWKYLMSPRHFFAPYGPTTVEQLHPEFTLAYSGHECQWNGPSWPFSTAVTLTALVNLLNNYSQEYINKADFFTLLKVYAQSHYRVKDDMSVVPWIDENLNPLTGDWIARTRLKTWADGTWSKAKGGKERGKDYNHSTFNDLIITGIVGLRPQEGARLCINPLAPADMWDWFCLDRVPYHGKMLTVIWDKTGAKYGKGKGLTIWSNGKKIGHLTCIDKIEIKLR
ncbi:MAG: hypothetical protein LBR06_05035 [Bacteroidales bacterium]|jgi:hypothetical protein|nr:hypothetical protein [Bacteroidales bacterium]